MTWPFCPDCGTILDPPETEFVTCSFCPFSCRFIDMEVPQVVTKSAPTQKPAWIGDDEDGEAMGAGEKHAMIDEPCPKCNHHQLYFYTMQLRSVDEGSTVFYECPKCTHKFSINN